MLSNQRVRTDRTCVNFIVYKMVKLEVIHYTYGYGVVEGLTRTSVVKSYLSVNNLQNFTLHKIMKLLIIVYYFLIDSLKIVLSVLTDNLHEDRLTAHALAGSYISRILSLAEKLKNVSTNSEPQDDPDNELKLFQNALDFADLRVRDCMVPRIDVEAVDVEHTTIEELTERFVESKYSRLFVYRNNLDSIIGYVNLKSLFTHPTSINEVVMKVHFVPETMPLQALLQTFIKNHSNIAVVIDEFGGTAGIISMEDVLEEIFGEIEDEHDEAEEIEKKVGEGEYVLSCRLEVEYLNERYGLEIEESKEYDTLAGLIIYHYEGIPTAGQTLVIGHLQIRILRTTRSRLELARVKKIG